MRYTITHYSASIITHGHTHAEEMNHLFCHTLSNTTKLY